MTLELMQGFIEEIEIRHIHPPRNSLRDELGRLDGLRQSIMDKGLLHPIVVRPAEDSFEVVAGMRRLQACKSLGMKKIPCHVVNLDEREAYETSLIENVQRRTLDPVEEARAFDRYIKEFGYGSVSELGRMIGKSEEYVSQRLRLLRLSPKTLAKVSSRLITASHAVELIGLGAEEQDSLSELVLDGEFSAKEVRKVAKQIRKEPIKSGFYLDSVSSPREERKTKRTNRILGKWIAILKATMVRLDDLVGDVDEEEWLVKEVLLEHRRIIHQAIDELLKVERKVKKPR